MVVGLDLREEYDEERWIGVGLIQKSVCVVVYTEIEHETIRIISARKAKPWERKRFQQAIADGLGKTGQHEG